MKKIIIASSALVALLAASPVRAQDRWSFELRAGGAMPGEDFGSGDLQYAAFGFEGTVRYRLAEHLAAYAGWDWLHFDADEEFALSDAEFEETGYVFGLRFEHPFRGESGGPGAWVRLGGTWDHIEVENEAGEIVSDSGHGLGWEMAGGLALGLGDRWILTPGLRYRSLSRDVTWTQATVPVDLDYLALEIGFARPF
ncbi:MAG: outer membrane beta-barrel protein [Gemmatimonadota bacterium]|jgi:hypothetical protein